MVDKTWWRTWWNDWFNTHDCITGPLEDHTRYVRHFQRGPSAEETLPVSSKDGGVDDVCGGHRFRREPQGDHVLLHELLRGGDECLGTADQRHVTDILRLDLGVGKKYQLNYFRRKSIVAHMADLGHVDALWKRCRFIHPKQNCPSFTTNNPAGFCREWSCKTLIFPFYFVIFSILSRDGGNWLYIEQTNLFGKTLSPVRAYEPRRHGIPTEGGHRKLRKLGPGRTNDPDQMQNYVDTNASCWGWCVYHFVGDTYKRFNRSCQYNSDSCQKFDKWFKMDRGNVNITQLPYLLHRWRSPANIRHFSHIVWYQPIYILQFPQMGKIEKTYRLLRDKLNTPTKRRLRLCSAYCL